MKDGPRYDFPAISDTDGSERRAGPGLGEAAFGDTTTQEETLYEDTGGDWRKGERGQQIGTVLLKHMPTATKGRVLVSAWFLFDNGETAEYAGLVPGQGSWKGKGSLGYRSGTGKHAERRGALEVEAFNPKRWG